jgi:drug/metabolite transporter (DMT)-like permease
MATQSTDFLLNSLKGKIWLAVSGLAVLNCIVGVGVYFVASYYLTDSFLTVLLPFMFVAFIMMVFGWWLSNEVLGPIEKLSLFQKRL